MSAEVLKPLPTGLQLKRWENALWDLKRGQAARAYLEGHAISEDIARKAGLGFDGSRRICIPIRGKDGSLLECKRHAIVQENGPKSILVGGRGHHLFPANWHNPGTATLVCEGECDALALYGLGANAITTTGGSGGLRDPKLVKLLLQRVRLCTEVILVPDGDKAGEAWAEDVGRHLTAAGLRVCYVLLKRGEDPCSTLAAVPADERSALWGRLVLEARVREEVDEQIMEGKNKPQVYVPGEWPNIGRVGHGDFARAVRPHLPVGEELFRHGDELKRIAGNPGARQLKPETADGMRSLTDDCVDLVKERWDEKQEAPRFTYSPCSRNLAALLLDNMSRDLDVPAIESISSFPVWARTPGGKWCPSRSGFDPATGHYYDQPPELDGFCPAYLHPDNDEDRERVWGLLSTDRDGPLRHFPWKQTIRSRKHPVTGRDERLVITPAPSAVNLLAAIVTLAMRPGLPKTPLIAVSSSIPRTGKTLLLEEGVVRLVTGLEPRIRVMPSSEEEMGKHLLAIVREGSPYAVFDNVRVGSPVSSGVLSGFLTASTFSGRLLGHNTEISFPNRTLVAITGNSLTMSRELAMRTLPIELVPEDDHPEARQLPHLATQVLQMRAEILGIIHGMINSWVRAGCPPGRPLPLGGFEPWCEAASGVLSMWGLDENLGANLESWRNGADYENDDTVRFLIAWENDGGRETPWRVTRLLKLVRHLDLFPEVLERSERGQRVAFSRGVLTPLVEVPRRIVREDGHSLIYRVARTGSDRDGYQYRLDVRQA